MDNALGTTCSTKKEIVLAGERDVCLLGGPIPIIVRYINHTTGTVSFRDPTKTWEVKLMVGRRKGDPKVVPFGQIFFSKKGDLERRTIKKAAIISLEPNDVYEFKYDVGHRWPELFVPGVNVIRIKDLSDDAETALSNEFEVRIVYDRSTFPMLLTIAANKESTADSLRFANDWIGLVYPGFSIATENLTDIQRDENRRRTVEAGAWWDAHKTDPETLKRIEDLNW